MYIRFRYTITCANFINRRKTRITRKRQVLHMRMDTIVQMKIIADF